MSRVKLHVTLLAAPQAAENTVAMAARLCYSGAEISELKEKIEAKDQQNFINRLTEMGHMSPVEHISFTFGVEGVSRALLAQITRHRIASFSVQSQRYVDQAKDGFDYVVPPSIEALGEEAVERYTRQMETIASWYEEWVEALGGGKESARQDARFVLPNAAETKMMVTMNARELIHFFRLRGCNRAQWEIRALAWAMMGLCYAAAPGIFGNCGPACIGDACSEAGMSCGRMKDVKQKHKELLEFVKNHEGEPDFEERMSEWASKNAQ
ncbi:MAG: FAD-dependent thymidylate synthase [Christensenellales bacterium]|jgi:thymidylate synthase (FAD)